MNDSRRVVVTGFGAVSCLGVGVPALWQGLLAGRSGIGPITSFDASAFRCRVAGEVRDLDIHKYFDNPKEPRRLDAHCHFAVAAGDEALAHAQLRPDGVDPNRVGVLVGGGIGGIRTLEDQARVLFERGPLRSSPFMVPMMIIDMASGYLSIRYGFRGPNLGIVTACASGAHAIGEAAWIIKRGDADVMITGGVEACVCGLGLTGFGAMRALTERNDEPTRASRPFDRERDGFAPAEGGGILVLESLEHAQARGADIHAELIGYGLTGDAYHITAPDPDGSGASRAMTAALRQAGIRPEDVDYVNAHGTSTPLNDKIETMALKTAMGQTAYRVPVSSTKSMTGHTLGAAGGLESIICIQALKHGVVPPTINYEYPDPDCDLDYVPNVAREVQVRIAMNVNLGFGGHNAVLLLRRWQ
jgi:3-oxoacyl-[acyl-carrier-protein] synthase II